MTMDDFNAGLKHYRRRGLLLLAAAGVLSLLFVAAATAFEIIHRGADESQAAQPLSLIVRPLVGVGIIFTLLGGMAINEYITRRDPRVQCPHCRAYLVHAVERMVTIATKNCHSCGKRVIDGDRARD